MEILDRLMHALAELGISGRGTLAKVAKKTGYKAGTLSPIFNGKEPLTDRVIKVICAEYGINEEYVRGSNLPMFQPTTTLIQSTGGAVTSGSAAITTTSAILQGLMAEASHLSEAEQLRLWTELRERRDAVATPEQDEKVLRGGGG